MASINHTHQYRRTKLKDSVVYRCMLPGCTHYTREAFIINKIGLCPYCGKEFLISRDLARRTTVHCMDCTKGKKLSTVEPVNFLKELANDSSRIVETPGGQFKITLERIQGSKGSDGNSK